MMTHDDVFARLSAADPLPDESLITDEDLTLLTTLVDGARTSSSTSPLQAARAEAVAASGPSLQSGWRRRPVLAAAAAAAVVTAAVGVGVVLAPTRDAPPVGDMPVATTISPSEPTTPLAETTTVPTTTPAREPSARAVVAGLVWEVQPFGDALDSGRLGFGRTAYETNPGLWLYERLQVPEIWPHDRFAKPDHDCLGGWSGEQILDSPDRTVAICDAGDWTPQRVRTFVYEDGWVEVPTDPVLWSGWINGDDNRDGSLGPAGIFGAAVDIGTGFMANGTADFLWASDDGITWVEVPDVADAFPERSITRAIGTSNGLVYIVGELDWPPGDAEGELVDRLVVWTAELPDQGDSE